MPQFYCIVEEIEGQKVVTRKVQGLPDRVRCADGYTKTSLDQLTEEELIASGVYPLIVEGDVFDPDTQVQGEGVYTIEEDCVKLTYPITDLTPEQIETLADEKLTQAKRQKKSLVEYQRSVILEAGFPYLEKQFACDREAKTNMLIQYQGFMVEKDLDPEWEWPQDFGWKAVGDSEVTLMTESQFKTLIKDAGAYCSQIYTKSFEIKKAIDDLASIDEVTAFSINFE